MKKIKLGFCLMVVASNVMGSLSDVSQVYWAREERQEDGKLKMKFDFGRTLNSVEQQNPASFRDDQFYFLYRIDNKLYQLCFRSVLRLNCSRAEFSCSQESSCVIVTVPIYTNNQIQ